MPIAELLENFALFPQAIQKVPEPTDGQVQPIGNTLQVRILEL
jgi:hypothetical protein